MYKKSRKKKLDFLTRQLFYLAYELFELGVSHKKVTYFKIRSLDKGHFKAGQSCNRKYNVTIGQ